VNLISVVIPVHNGAVTLRECLNALQRTEPAPFETLVVDDGSRDESARIARECGARVITLTENVGAARAKNRGAEQARGDVLFFTDADVIVKPDAVARLAADFADARVAGVVGVLDCGIPFRDFASQFKNLWMNFTYARLAPASSLGLFYTSAAAMRRAIFLALGGFDENYRGASIAEDTEFGQRAWAAGHKILLDPAFAVEHRKRYALGEILRTDFQRARALTLMRLRKWGQPFFTSVPVFYQLAVPVIYLAMLGIIAALVLQNALGLAVMLSALVVFYALNAAFLAFLARVRGMGFALRAALFLPVDVIVVGAGMLVAALEFARGVRY
jgi:GT2 family glycosyltransferase